MGRHVSAILSSRAKIKLKIQWYMCSQFYSDWRASNLNPLEVAT
jgi:hypothetical protein